MPDRIENYHAHVYYELETKDAATLVRDAIASTFPQAVLGRWHDKPIGPHPTGSYQVAFEPDLFAEIIPWLSLNRQGLVILVHPETGDNLADHSEHAIWMGGMPDLNLAMFEKNK